MIKIEIKTIYYYKKQYHHETTKEKKIFQVVSDVIEYFKSYNPIIYINEKDISIIEEIDLFQPTEYGVKRYYKRIDPIMKTIESNYKEEKSDL